MGRTAPLLVRPIVDREHGLESKLGGLAPHTRSEFTVPVVFPPLPRSRAVCKSQVNRPEDPTKSWEEGSRSRPARVLEGMEGRIPVPVPVQRVWVSLGRLVYLTGCRSDVCCSRESGRCADFGSLGPIWFLPIQEREA